jgi:hypothetical protein
MHERIGAEKGRMRNEREKKEVMKAGDVARVCIVGVEAEGFLWARREHRCSALVHRRSTSPQRVASTEGVGDVVCWNYWMEKGGCANCKRCKHKRAIGQAPPRCYERLTTPGFLEG